MESSSASTTAGNREVLVQTGTYLESAADVRQLVVAVRGTANERKPVFISDVATVEDGPDQPKSYAWFGSKEGEFPAVTLQMAKQPGVNAADIAVAAIKRIESLRNTVIPEGVEVTVTRNYGASATEKDIQAFVATRVADFKVPKKLLILPEIPKGATGKLQRIGLAQKLGLA